jgi:hypothetical protein
MSLQVMVRLIPRVWGQLFAFGILRAKHDLRYARGHTGATVAGISAIAGVQSNRGVQRGGSNLFLPKAHLN